MTHDPRDLREKRELSDERLGKALRNALGGDRAPEAWVKDALEIPRRAGLPRRRPWPAGRATFPIPVAPSGLGRAREPWLVVLFPHLAGLLLLGGLVLVWSLRPELVHAALEPVARTLRQISEGSGPGFWTVAGFLAPVMILAIDQGVRGFPILRRLHLTH